MYRLESCFLQSLKLRYLSFSFSLVLNTGMEQRVNFFKKNTLKLQV